MLMSSTYTALAKETTDISYNTLSVEFSDNLGTAEDLNVMVTEEHLYVDAEQLGDRLGYQVEVGNEYVAIYNKILVIQFLMVLLLFIMIVKSKTYVI